MDYKKNEQKNGLALFNYNNSSIAFRTTEGNVMVNATQMAKPFGKRTRDWLITEQSRNYIKTLAEVRNLASVDLQLVVKGGNKPNQQGTWFHEDVAIEFARWLSPEFGIWCNDRVKEMLLKDTQPKEISENGSDYPEEVVFTVKMGNVSNQIYVKNGVIFAKFSAISKYMGYETTPIYYLDRWGMKNSLKVTVGKVPAWFINSKAFDEMVKLSNDIPFQTIATIYKDLFGIEKLASGDYKLYTFQFTDSEMLEVITALNQKPVQKQKVMDLLLGGKKGGSL